MCLTWVGVLSSSCMGSEVSVYCHRGHSALYLESPCPPGRRFRGGTASGELTSSTLSSEFLPLLTARTARGGTVGGLPRTALAPAEAALRPVAPAGQILAPRWRDPQREPALGWRRKRPATDGHSAGHRAGHSRHLAEGPARRVCRALPAERWPLECRGVKGGGLCPPGKQGSCGLRRTGQDRPHCTLEQWWQE